MEIFYHLNPKKLTRYQPYLNEWYKQREIHVDAQAWKNGSYVQAAIGSCVPRGRRYPDRPVLMDRFDIEDGEESYTMTDADRFWAFAQSLNQAKEIKAIEEKIAEERADIERSRDV